MAETETIKSYKLVETQRPEEVSLLKEAPGLLSSKPLLEVYRWVGRNRDSLFEATRRAGDLIAKNRNKAVLAGTSLVLAASGAIACSESEASPPGVHVSFPETPTTAVESKATVPQTEEPTIIDDREPALTPVETQAPSAPFEAKTQEPQTTTQNPEEESKITHQTIYKKILQQIESSNLSQQQKLEAEQIVSDLEKMDQSRNQLLEAYYNIKDEQGHPLLIELIKNRYQIDPSLNYDYDPADLKAIYRKQIFFVHDTELWEKVGKPSLKEISQGQLIAEDLTKLQNLSNQFENQRFYLDLNTAKGKEINVQVNLVPKNPEEQEMLEDTLSHIQDITDKYPLFGTLNIEVAGSSHSHYQEENGKIAIRIALENRKAKYPLPPTQSEHELAHPLSISSNRKNFVAYHSAEEIVRAMILQEKILNNPALGIRFNSLERMFDPRTNAFLEIKRPISGEEAGLLASIYPDLLWMPGEHQSNLPENQNPQQNGIFSQYLKNEVFMNLKSSKPTTYESLKEFLEKEDSNLEKLSQSSTVWRLVTERMKRKVETLENARKIYNQLPRNNYGMIEIFGNLILAEGFMQNDPEILGLFDSSDKKGITQKLTDLADSVREEHFAEMMRIFYKGNLTEDNAVELLEDYSLILANRRN